MTRDEFQPATILNLLAAAWIQFMVHDWFVHERSKTEFDRDPDAAGRRLGRSRASACREAVPDPAPAGSTRPPAYANLNSHWWDASQIYGCDARHGGEAARRKIGGKLRIEPTGLLPVDPDTGVHFSRLHRQLVDRPGDAPHAVHAGAQLHLRPAGAPASATGTTTSSIARRKLINSALMAKIHTVEWTPAIVPHPIIKLAMNVNWSGLAGEDLQDASWSSSTTRSCSAASSARRPTTTRRRIR